MLNRFLAALLLMIGFSAQAQFKLDAEIRPRYEYRHGFKSLYPDGVKPAQFISQRTRLNAGYMQDNFEMFLSFQNIRVWGDVPQLNSADANGVMMHQAWAKYHFNKNWYTKIGRQEIVLDDSRIFGNVGWAQQARSHDALMFGYQNEKQLHVKLFMAYNQASEGLTGNELMTSGTYKALQSLWIHKDWESNHLSILFLNNGQQYVDNDTTGVYETSYSQTIGGRFNGKKNGFSYAVSAYYQFGMDGAKNDLSAYDVLVDLKYQPKKLGVGLGTEILSGNDEATIVDGQNNAFNPFYGTNHKFNGFMDYFYVGNHFDNVGLMDFNVNLQYKFTDKSKITGYAHYFMSQAEITPDVSNALGTEVDLVYSYNLNEFINLQMGYSQMFADEGLEIVKNVYDDNTNNWAWMMLTIKPTLFEKKKSDDQVD